MCYDQEKLNVQETRWTGAWISFLLLKMFSGIKDTWESFAVSLGVICKEENDNYTRLQRKKDLEKANNLNDVFAKFTWGRKRE